MKLILRLLYGVLIFLAVYILSLFVIPGIGFIRDLVLKYEALDFGVMTQLSFLVFSILLIFILGKGEFRRFGFRGVSLVQLGWALLIGIVVSGLLMFVDMVIMSVVLGPGPPPEEGVPGGAWLNTILTVWILASTCEEIFYRGFLQNFLAPLRAYGMTLWKWRISVPVVFSATAFGLGHLCLLGIMPGLLVGQIIVSCFVNGLLAGYFMEKTGSLIPSVGIHMMFNVTGMMIPVILMSLMGV